MERAGDPRAPVLGGSIWVILRFDPFAHGHIRRRVLARDRQTCYWCGGQADTVDHIMPWSRGGLTTMQNLVAACRDCNGERGDRPAAEFARLKGVPVPRPQPA